MEPRPEEPTGRPTASEHKSKSVLEAHPDYVGAIGMINIETTNLEHVLGTLLAAFLDMPEQVGHIIYLTPKTTIGRLAIIENLVAFVLEEKSAGAKELDNITRRAKAIFDKRHKIVHGTWGITDGEISIMPSPPRHGAKCEPYSLDGLKEIIKNIRDLVMDAHESIKGLRIFHRDTRLRAAHELAAQLRDQKDKPDTQAQSPHEKN